MQTDNSITDVLQMFSAKERSFEDSRKVRDLLGVPLTAADFYQDIMDGVMNKAVIPFPLKFDLSVRCDANSNFAIPNNVRFDGDLTVDGYPFESLPYGMHVLGNLSITSNVLKAVPINLQVDGHIELKTPFMAISGDGVKINRFEASKKRSVSD